MRARLVIAAIVALLLGSVAAAQFRRGGAASSRELRYATLEDFDGSFQFCRIVFRPGIATATAATGASTFRAPIRTCRSACPS